MRRNTSPHHSQARRNSKYDGISEEELSAVEYDSKE